MQKQPIAKDKLSQFNLREESVVKLQNIANELLIFESDRKAMLPTSLTKIKRLQEIEKLATGINEGIKSLDTGSYLHLDRQLAMASESDDVPRASGISDKLDANIVYMQRMACNLALAAKCVSDAIEQRDGKNGRKSVLGAYAGFIAGIAVSLKADDIKAGRGGPFEKICEVIFEYADVHAKPEGAIKYFLTNMHPEYSSCGYTL